MVWPKANNKKPSNEYEKLERMKMRLKMRLKMGLKMRLKMNIDEYIRVDKDSFKHSQPRYTVS